MISSTGTLQQAFQECFEHFRLRSISEENELQARRRILPGAG